MASTLPPIEVRALYDGTQLKQGMADAEADVKELAREVDYAADDINQSLRSVDDGVSSSLGSGGTLDQGTDVGVDSMKDMASTAREEVPAAMLDMRDGVTGAAEGIAQAMASLGPGGTVVASVIAGFVVMKGRAEAAAQAMRDQVNGALSAIEVKARTTNTAIEKMYEKQLTFEQTLERFGDGDAAKGYEKLAGFAETLGVETEDVVAFIQGRQIPAAQKVADIIKLQGDSIEQGTVNLTEQQVVAGTLNRLAADELRVRETTIGIAKDSRDALQNLKDVQQDLNDETGRTADNSERAERAAERLANSYERAAAAAERLNNSRDPNDWDLA